MHQTKFKLLAVLIALMMTFSSVASATAANTVSAKSAEVQLVFDGQTLKLPEGQYVFMLKGTTYVPVRFVSYALQKNVSWDNASSTVSVSSPTDAQLKNLQSYLQTLITKSGEKASAVGVSKALTEKAAKFVFDGKEVKLPAGQAAYILNGSLYVPVRFMSESSGVKITWDQQTKQIAAASPSSSNSSSANGGGSTTPTTPSQGSTDSSGGGTTPVSGGSGGTGGGGGGGTVTKPSYESITSSTKSKLEALEATCEQTMMAIAGDYIAGKLTVEQAKAKGNLKLEECKTKFNGIVDDAEQQLKSNGYSTAIIQEYRDTFNKKVDDGLAVLEGMLG